MWNGAFSPRPNIQKHRDHCGDITNHIEIKSVEKDYVMRMVTVVVGFVASAEQDYVFEIPMSEWKDGSDRQMVESVVAQLGA